MMGIADQSAAGTIQVTKLLNYKNSTHAVIKSEQATGRKETKYAVLNLHFQSFPLFEFYAESVAIFFWSFAVAQINTVMHF